MKNSRVVFLQVKTVKEKLLKISETAAFHFEKKEHFVVYAPDEKAESFIDDLLWKAPPESFLPHSISGNDWIRISQKKEELQNTRFVFNLRPTPLLQDSLQIIYELEDLTSPNKKMLSRKRFEAYKALGWIIEAR